MPSVRCTGSTPKNIANERIQFPAEVRCAAGQPGYRAVEAITPDSPKNCASGMVKGKQSLMQASRFRALGACP